jgi:molybdenum-dependent DNA-binding transcriptional regulator ModE
MDYKSVSQAVEKGGSIREAAKLLGKSYTSIQWWLARNGYKVVKKASLVPIHADQKKGE